MAVDVGNIGEFLEGDVEIAGKKIPKAALVAAAVVIVVILAILARRGSADVRSAFSPSSPVNDGASGSALGDSAAANEAALGDATAALEQSLAQQGSDLAEQLNQQLGSATEQLNSQLEGLYDSLGSAQQLPDIPSELPGLPSFSTVEPQQPLFYDLPTNLPSYGGFSPNPPIPITPDLATQQSLVRGVRGKGVQRKPPPPTLLSGTPSNKGIIKKTLVSGTKVTSPLRSSTLPVVIPPTTPPVFPTRSNKPVYRPPAPKPVYRPPAPKPVYRPPAPKPVYRPPAPRPVYRPPVPIPSYRPPVRKPVTKKYVAPLRGKGR